MTEPSPEPTDSLDLAAVLVLAAGEGTRMRSSTPKVLHPIGGRSLVGHVLAATRELGARRTAVVVRHQSELVGEHVRALVPDAVLVEQDDVPGTGAAVRSGLSVLDAAAHADTAARGVPLGREGQVLGDGVEGAVLVVAGDLPLLDAGTLRELLAAHVADASDVTVLTTVVADPTGYGRIVRDSETGDVLRIVEHRDASAEVRELREINSSVYVFDATVLRAGLAHLTNHNSQGELYLTDVIEHARASGGHVRAVVSDDEHTVEGVNDRVQLATLGRILNDRVVADWMRAGVTVVDPATTWIDVDVELAPDVTLLPGTQLHGATSIATGATVGPDTTLTDVEVGEGATVTRTQGTLAVIGAHASVGPFAYLRPGSVLGANGKIGTFVETKNAEIGAGSKVPHLSYVGDATIGEGTNIGAASVFVNYDGVRKQRSTIGSHARTGADNMFVAPVTVGDGAYTGAGSVIRNDVPAGALGLSAGAQRNIEGWVARRRPGTPSAAAASAADAPPAPAVPAVPTAPAVPAAPTVPPVPAAPTAPEPDPDEPSTLTAAIPVLGAQALRELRRHADAAGTTEPTSPQSAALEETNTSTTEGATDR